MAVSTQMTRKLVNATNTFFFEVGLCKHHLERRNYICKLHNCAHKLKSNSFWHLLHVTTMWTSHGKKRVLSYSSPSFSPLQLLLLLINNILNPLWVSVCVISYSVGWQDDCFDLAITSHEHTQMALARCVCACVCGLWCTETWMEV